ncbi:hypothetical protein F5B22DRAFT_608744 [Xylaria bambusicola]|uniref:uncharacterized protein n=1 Tax=Xylaria bambusicola TaxID=326684 RepID=UPI0020072711|nr:uncharacterized protein F5B22DRAFT_608744 [Xylaria bambusicola]KAI0514882.1 hypothetical protein F5B22DRAFT_608744 [Xylaria bambusicola]
MKFSGVVSALALTGAAVARTGKAGKQLPTMKIANIEVVDTPIVRNAIKAVEEFIPLQPYLYGHVMRSWLFGAAAFNNNATLKAQIDLEAHAIGTLLHDLGWDMREDSPWTTKEHRFEVDGGAGALKFIQQHPCSKKEWPELRQMWVYDAIALQAISDIPDFKSIQTQWMIRSVGFEFPGPRSPLIKDEDYDSILAAFPNDYLFRGTNETFTWMAATKPNAVYNTFIQDFGTAYVPGFNATGHRLFDVIQGGLAAELAANAS